MSEIVAGTLYVVATPIGNLGDLTPRAREVLGGVTAIGAEDTRNTAVLLGQFGIGTPLIAVHDRLHQQDVRYGGRGDDHGRSGSCNSRSRYCP